MRTILFILLSLSLTSSAIGQDYIAASVKSASLKSTIHTEYTDLLFFATSTDYNSWYNYAFFTGYRPKSTVLPRRSNNCC